MDQGMAIKINSKIIGYSIKKEDATPEPANPRQVMHEEIKRPEELKGYTYKIKTPLSDHALYVTINNIVLNESTEHEQEYPFEIFINSKNMEHFQWVRSDELDQIRRDPVQMAEIREEVADITAFLLSFANAMDIDLSDAFRAKMVKNAEKYPADEFRGRFKK